MLSAPEIFDRYEEARPRFPNVRSLPQTRDISALTDIADSGSAFVFDAFGELNVGETPIEGADHRLKDLRSLGCKIRVLTNAASYDHSGAVAKFQGLGMSIEDDEIITSCSAALSALTPDVWGAIAASEDRMHDIGTDVIRLGDIRVEYDQVSGFLFLSTQEWNDRRQKLLEASLSKKDRPVVIANAELVAPRDNGISLEPGHFGHLLVDKGFSQVRFFGKPFLEVYDLVERTLSHILTEKVIMCGDAHHTDILGAAARGWRTVLVTRDGLFKGHDTAEFRARSGLHPDWRLSRI